MQKEYLVVAVMLALMTQGTAFGAESGPQRTQGGDEPVEARGASADEASRGRLHAKRSVLLAQGIPANAQPLVDEALKSEISGNHAAAVENYKKAIQLAPNTAKLHSSLAAALQQTDDFQGAREAYQKAIGLDKKGASENWYFIGVLDEHFNRGPLALQEYQTYVRENPSGLYLNEAQERIRQLMANTAKTAHLVTKAAQEKAAAEQAKAAQVAQSYNDALRLQQEGKLDEAIAKYEEAVQGKPNDSAIWYALGTAYQNKQDFDKAISSYEKSIGLNPKNADTKALLKQCKTAKAAPLVESAVKKQTTADAAGKYDLTGAIFDYEKALQIDDDATTRMNLGTAYQANNNLPKAMENYNRAVNMDKKLTECYYYLGTLQEANKAPALAIVEYKKYLQFAPAGTSANDAKERLKILGAPVK